MDRVQLTLRIPEEIYEALEKISRDSGLNMTCLIKSILYHSYLKMN